MLRGGAWPRTCVRPCVRRVCSRRAVALVNIHASEQVEIARALDVLERHHAHLIKQFGRWTTTELKR